MCKEHIKALKQVVKLNNRGTLPILKMLCHTNGMLMATDLTVMVQIKTPSIRDGIWHADALDLGFREELIDKEYTIEDYPELPETKVVQELELTDEDMAKILRASDFISKDMTRPVLTGVAIKEDKVYGTDGYKMYRNKISNTLTEQVILPTGCVKVLKAFKADKYNWTLTIYDDARVALTSGNMIIGSKIIEGTLPQYETLLENTTADVEVYLDLNETAGAKGYHLVIDPKKETTEMYNPDSGNRINLGSGRVGNGHITYGKDYERNVVMPMINHDNKDNIIIDLAVLKPFGKNKVRLLSNPYNKQVEVEVLYK